MATILFTDIVDSTVHARQEGDAAWKRALHDGWKVDPARIDAPVRIVWGTEDQLQYVREGPRHLTLRRQQVRARR
jgi:pimeloyl-ACP methyl ester carboxylesterase